MIVPFWSWNLSDTTHVRSHTKFQLVWAINTAFTRGGLNQPPPSLKCVAGTPSLLGLKGAALFHRQTQPIHVWLELCDLVPPG